MRIAGCFIAIAGGVLAIGLAGCSSVVNSHLQKEEMIQHTLNGNDVGAAAEINAKLKSTSGTGDELMWRLESGSHSFNKGDFKSSINQFQAAEKLIAEYDGRATVSVRDAGAEGAMAVTNLNALPYRGWCRDRIALSIYKSLAYLGEGREEAFRAQLRRLRDAQKQVMEDYKKFFEQENAELKAAREQHPEEAAKLGKSSDDLINDQGNEEFRTQLKQVRETAHRGYGSFLNPLAIFLSGLGSVRDDNYENARIDFQRLYEAMPQNPLAMRYYRTVMEAAGREKELPAALTKVKPFDFPLSRDCVYVIFANGRGAAFKQVAIYFPVMTAWPVCEYYPAPFRSLTVVAGARKYETEQIADMDGILSQEYQERLPGMITRIVLSTAIKEAASYAATYAAAEQDPLAGLAVLLGSMIYRATFNTADTRSWELLPKEFQLTQLPMPRDRQLLLQPDGRGDKALRLTIPGHAGSAIVYVYAPAPGVLRGTVLTLGK